MSFSSEVREEVEKRSFTFTSKHSKISKENGAGYQKEFLRINFIYFGSIADPERFYHMEFVYDTREEAEGIQSLIAGFGITPGIVERKGRYVVYIKDSEAISDMLNLLGAYDSLMKFENIRISRDFTNSLTRLNNCDVANEVKSQTAARKQLEDIARIEEMHLHPGEKLQAVMDLRKENPEASLLELCALYEEKTGTPVSKSGMKHRFVRIHELAEKGGN